MRRRCARWNSALRPLDWNGKSSILETVDKAVEGLNEVEHGRLRRVRTCAAHDPGAPGVQQPTGHSQEPTLPAGDFTGLRGRTSRSSTCARCWSNRVWPRFWWLRPASWGHVGRVGCPRVSARARRFAAGVEASPDSRAWWARGGPRAARHGEGRLSGGHLNGLGSGYLHEEARDDGAGLLGRLRRAQPKDPAMSATTSGWWWWCKGRKACWGLWWTTSTRSATYPAWRSCPHPPTERTTLQPTHCPDGQRQRLIQVLSARERSPTPSSMRWRH